MKQSATKLFLQIRRDQSQSQSICFCDSTAPQKKHSSPASLTHFATLSPVGNNPGEGARKLKRHYQKNNIKEHKRERREISPRLPKKKRSRSRAVRGAGKRKMTRIENTSTGERSDRPPREWGRRKDT